MSDRPGHRTPELTGEGLVLLPVGPEHAEAMASVLADPVLHTVIGGEPPTVDELRERYRRQSAGSPRPDEVWHTWVVVDEASGDAVGYVQATITGVGAAADQPTAELAWVVGTPWQGRGLARRAARVVLAEVRRVGVGRVVAHVAPGHVPSERVAAALGLRPTDLVVDDEVRWVLDL